MNGPSGLCASGTCVRVCQHIPSPTSLRRDCAACPTAAWLPWPCHAGRLDLTRQGGRSLRGVASFSQPGPRGPGNFDPSGLLNPLVLSLSGTRSVGTEFYGQLGLRHAPVSILASIGPVDAAAGDLEMPCSVAVSVQVVMWPTVSDLGRKNHAWKEVARHSPLSARPAGQTEEAQAEAAEHRLLQNASAVGLRCPMFKCLRI